MRSSIRNLVIVAGCVVVLGGALLALKLTGNAEPASSSASSAVSIELVSKKSEDVVSMNVVNQKGSYTLIPVPKTAASGSSKAASGSGRDVTYTVRELSGFPVNTSETESVVKNGFSLVASRNLGTVGSLGEYGLDKPQATVRVSFRDGSTFDYKIGRATATDPSAYYMCGLNSDNVYIVSIEAGLLESPDYFISKEILALADSNGQGNFTKITLSGAAYPQPVTLSAAADGMKITAPAEYPADAEALSALQGSLASLTAESVAAVRPDAAALKKYGLGSPAASVSFTAGGKSYTLRAGGVSGENYYVMLDGVDVVYTAAKSGVDPWASKGLFGLRSKQLLEADAETVRALSVTADGAQNVLNVARTKDKKQSADGKTVYAYKLTGNGGRALDFEKNYKNFFGHLQSVSILADAKDKPDASPDLTVRYAYFDKKTTDTLEFVKSADRRYTAVVNGRVFGIVTQDDVDQIKSEIKALEAGQAIS